MSYLKLYFKFISIFLKSKLEYPFGFFMEIFANIVLVGIYYIGIGVIFSKFNNINGWSYYEVLFLFNINWISYSFSGLFFWAPMLNLGETIRNGEFDSYLIRPMDPLAHIVLKQFQYTFIARLFLALIFFADSIIHLGVVWNISKVIFLIVTVFSGFVIHSAILVLIGAISFWIIQNREFGKLLSDNNNGIRTFIDFPVSIYKKGIQFVLTFIFPYAFINFYPATFILNKAGEGIFQPVFQYMAPVVAISLAVLAWKIWNRGLRRYNSIGN